MEWYAVVNGSQDIAWAIEAEPPAEPLSGTQPIEWQIDPFRASIAGFQTVSWALGADTTQTQVVLTDAPTGLVETLAVSIITYDGTVTILFPTTSGIVEIPEGTGRYVATVTRPPVGRYWVVWSDGDTSTEQELVVIQTGRLEIDTRVAATVGA